MLFSSDVRRLESETVWEYDCGTKRSGLDVIDETVRTLDAPEDFPPIDAAIVPGDRVAVVLDPNVPEITDVLTGVLRTLSQSDIGGIDIVLWDEATEETIGAVRDAAGDHPVSVHTSQRRDELRYLGADDDADPVYLNRIVVDADFVLPVHAIRAWDVSMQRDLTGIFPSLVDSATKNRFLGAVETASKNTAVAKMATETRWLLGVQLVLTVTANAEGQAGEIVAGTPEAIAKRIAPVSRKPDGFPPDAALVVASLDGNAQQQTWANAVRAAEAASRYSGNGGTIVVWTEIDTPPEGRLSCLDEARVDTAESDLEVSNGVAGSHGGASGTDVFPAHDASQSWAVALRRVIAEHRVLFRTRLDPMTLEIMGVGAIESLSELEKLSKSFQTCGVLRAAQFAGSTHPAASIEF